MTLTLILFAAAFTLISWLVFSPLFQNRQMDLSMILDNTVDTQKNLQAKRSELMLTLKELDFDFEMGKLSKKDYQELRSKYEQETIETLKRIEEEKDQWDRFLNHLGNP